MPVRLLRDWTDSTTMDGLEWQAEVFFVRLIMKADDHGRFHGNLKLLKSLCFPLRSAVRESDIALWLEQLQSAGLIALYETDGKPVLVIQKFGQSVRSKSRFPEPPEPPASDCKQLQTVAHLGVFVCEGVGGAALADANIPTEAEVLKFGAGTTPVIPEDYCRQQYARHSEEHRWITPQGRLIDWRAKFVRYWSIDRDTWGRKRNGNGYAKPKVRDSI